MLRILRRKLGLPARQSGDEAAGNARGGLVVGELLTAFLLLVLAMSSLTALMYSVRRTPNRSQIECDGKAANSKNCAPAAKPTKSASTEKLLVSGCATRSGSRVESCDEPAAGDARDGTTLRSRTDSASLQLVPKKTRSKPRPDLNFVR